MDTRLNTGTRDFMDFGGGCWPKILMAIVTYMDVLVVASRNRRTLEAITLGMCVCGNCLIATMGLRTHGWKMFVLDMAESMAVAGFCYFVLLYLVGWDDSSEEAQIRAALAESMTLISGSTSFLLLLRRRHLDPVVLGWMFRIFYLWLRLDVLPFAYSGY